MKTFINSSLFTSLLVIFSLLVTTAQAVETITYYHNDALGSPIAATDEAGNLKWREDYLPYGERLTKQDNSTNDTWFTGKQEDKATGLSYFGARWYDPVLGRFTGIDPVGFQEDNIHSFNRYAYANNNPYRFVDPDGRAPKGNHDKMNPFNFGDAGYGPGRSSNGGLSSGRSYDNRSFSKIKSDTDKTYSQLKDHPSVGSGKNFTQTQKKKILEANMKRNNGTLRSDLSGKSLIKAKQHKKGIKPPSNEAHVDHVCERCTGGTNSFSNARVLSRKENLSRPGKK